MYKKVFVIIIVLILVLSALSGCGAESDSVSEEYEKMSIERQMAGKDSGVKGKISVSYDEDAEDYGNNSSPQNTSDTERKLIKNGTIAIEVKNVDNTYLKVTELIKEIGGYEFSSSFTDDEYFKRMTITIKMPPIMIADFFRISSAFFDNFLSRRLCNPMNPRSGIAM